MIVKLTRKQYKDLRGKFDPKYGTGKPLWDHIYNDWRRMDATSPEAIRLMAHLDKVNNDGGSFAMDMMPWEDYSGIIDEANARGRKFDEIDIDHVTPAARMPLVVPPADPANPTLGELYAAFSPITVVVEDHATQIDDLNDNMKVVKQNLAVIQDRLGADENRTTWMQRLFGRRR